MDSTENITWSTSILASNQLLWRDPGLVHIIVLGSNGLTHRLLHLIDGSDSMSLANC